MRTETITVQVGEDVGPVDWDHPIAKGMPTIWREAAAEPARFCFTEYRREILRICMYDGWPYWRPRPAVQFIGPLGSPEWAFFDSYGIGPHSIRDREGHGTERPQASPQPRDEPSPLPIPQGEEP